jgi:hypothetical protein
MAKKSAKIPVILVSCVLVLALLVFAACLERGWLRGSAIPAMVSFVYKPRVEKTFDRLFEPVNEKLATYGFSLEWNQPAECAKGDSVYFEGVNETVGCGRMMALKLPGYSDATVAQWQSGAPGLARYLESEGWEKRSRTQVLSDLFSGRSSDQPLNVTYTKNRGSVQCELVVIYYAWEDNKDKATVYETCTRNFIIFKGSGPGGAP